MKRARVWRDRQVQLARYVNPAFGSVARMGGVYYSVRFSVGAAPSNVNRILCNRPGEPGRKEAV